MQSETAGLNTGRVKAKNFSLALSFEDLKKFEFSMG